MNSKFSSHRRQGRLMFVRFALLLSAVAVCACDTTKSTSEAVTNSIVTQTGAAPPPSPGGNDGLREIDYKGVKLRNFIASASSVKASENPAAPLEDEMDKPDYVESRSIVFDFQSGGGKRAAAESVSAIRIFPVAEFRQAYALSEEQVKSFDKALTDLQKYISETSVKREDQPGLHFYDVHQAMIARFKRLSFANGNGVFYLTQYTPDCATIINNENLEAVFHGLTNDGKYYVKAEFSVALDGLPNSSETTAIGEINLSKYSYCSEEKNINNQRYEKYLLSIERLLNQTAPEKFSPDLNQVEQTISSLEVNWRE